jgi:hypothetical protein
VRPEELCQVECNKYNYYMTFLYQVLCYADSILNYWVYCGSIVAYRDVNVGF